MEVTSEPMSGSDSASTSERGHRGPVGLDRDSLAGRLRRDPWSTALTISIDVLTTSIASILGLWLAARDRHIDESPWVALLYVPLVIILLAATGVYKRRLDRRFLDEIGPVETAAGLASMTLLAVLVVAQGADRPGQTVIRVWLCAAVLIPAGRLIRVGIQRSLRRNHILMAPTLILGSGHVAAQVVERLRSAPEYGLDPIGFLDADPLLVEFDDPPLPGVPYLGMPDTVNDAIDRTGAECVVVAFSIFPDEVLAEVVRVAQSRGLRVWVIPRMFDAIGEHMRVDHIGGLPVLALAHTNPHGWQFAVKDVLDRVSAGLGLLLISPVFLTLMALVKFSSPGPIFFRQPRVGRDGKVFDCLKFRTMRAAEPSETGFVPEAGAAPGGVEGVDRRTWIGKILRATSLDELPQLLNVLRGEMSLVGPRPERPEFVELFEEQIRRYGERHRVKAGVTGWAQVNGLRGQTSIADRAEYDNFYIENWSLALDLKILALTVLAVFRGAQ